MLPGMRAGRDGLEDHLLALHAINPDLRLTAETIVADEERVMARVTVQGMTAAAVPSGVIGPSPPWGALDVFRVVGGTIVERWSHSDDVRLVRPLAAVTIDLPVPSPRILTLQRLHIAPGDRWTPTAAGPHFLYLEDGALRVTSEETSASASVDSLSTGQSLVVASGARFAALNVGAGAARLLVVTFDVPRSPGGVVPEPESLPPGVAVENLVVGLGTDVPVGPAVLVLEHVALARRASLALSGGDGPALLALDTGRLGGAVWGWAWVRRGSDGRSVSTNEALLEAGDGLQLRPGGLAVLDATDGLGAVALVVTVRPAPAPGSS
jgi:hypothetical protein